jgi:hypothetical protein
MKKIKIWSIGVLAAAAWIADWLALRQIIYQNQPLTFFGCPALATALGIIFLTFFFLVNKNRLAAAILETVIFLGYLLVMPKNIFMIIGGVIFLVFLPVFELRLRSEEKNRVDFSIRRVMSGSITILIYALLLLIGFNLYYNSREDFRANPDAYYQKLGRTASKSVPYFTKDLPPQTARAITDQAGSVAVERIKQSAAAYERYFPLIFTVIAIALLGTFSFLLRWASLAAGFLIFKFLAMIGFFKLEPEMVEVKKLNIN